MAPRVSPRPLFGILFIGLVLLAASSSASAQGAPGFHFGISGGADFPVEDQEQVYDVGYNGTLMFNWNFGTSPFGIRLDGSYHRLSLEDAFDPFFADGRTQIIDGTFNFVIGPHFGSWFQPYIFGGVGAYALRFSGEDIVHDEVFTDWTTRFGWNAGTGFAFKAAPDSDIHLFVEGRYQSIDLDIDPFDDFDVTDRRFTVVTVNTGVIF